MEYLQESGLSYTFLLTCTVRHVALADWRKPVDKSVRITGLDMNGVGLIVAAVAAAMATDLSLYDSILQCWVRSFQPQWNISTTTFAWNTPLRHPEAVGGEWGELRPFVGCYMRIAGRGGSCVIGGSPFSMV